MAPSRALSWGLLALSAQSVLPGSQVFASSPAADIETPNNESLLWGPYRPNLYFGVRPRIPKSLMGGLMWTRVEDYTSVQHNFRHTCEQQELDGYGWDEYDVRSGGRQTLHDPGNGLDLTTEFIKFPGGQHGGSWGVRIKGTPRFDPRPGEKQTVVWYNTLDGLGSLEVKEAEGDDGVGAEGDVVLVGQTPELGEFEIRITEGKGEHPTHAHPSYSEKPLDRTFVQSGQAPVHGLWQAKALLFNELKKEIDALVPKYGQENPPPPAQLYTIKHAPGRGNIHFIQKVFDGPFEFDVLFSSLSAPEKITSQNLDAQIQSVTEAFSTRFVDVFEPKAPFTEEKYANFSKSMFSNLIGGIGYFYGDSRVDRSADAAYDEDSEGFWTEAGEAQNRNQATLEGPNELFTAIPSRPFFPRGFLWDEGFHLLPVIDWDTDLTLEIVKSWFSLMDEDGWIAREQILGDEARSKVPKEFQVQYPHYANPPTLFTVLTSFLDKLEGVDSNDKQDKKLAHEHAYASMLADKDAAKRYLAELYPLLTKHYSWFRKTQAGDVKSYDREAYSSKEAYRWRGRTPEHILTSGLDDYPRAQPPHPGELHVDLLSWVGLMTRSMQRIASYLGEIDDAAEYSKHLNAIKRNLDDLHWSKEESAYCDATIDEYEEHKLVCHKGYVSLFPFLTGMLEEGEEEKEKDEKVKAVLDLIEDPEELWSDFGLRSLSKKSEFYHTGEDYWRGPIWMNINYLALKSLLNLAQSPSPHAPRATTLYTSLRRNLITTVYNSWADTGFAWEQYNPETGKGQRTQHFTGWTSLVVKMLQMPDLEKGVGETIVEKVKEAAKKVSEEMAGDEEAVGVRDEL